MIFLVQFGINKHLQFFSNLLVFEKFNRAYLFQIAREIMWLPILIIHNNITSKSYLFNSFPVFTALIYGTKLKTIFLNSLEHFSLVRKSVTTSNYDVITQ